MAARTACQSYFFVASSRPLAASFSCKEAFSNSSAVLILSTIGIMCVYISVIMFKGAAAELREKKAAQQAGHPLS